MHDIRSARPLLFAEKPPTESGSFAVDGGHNLFWEEYGNPAGIPVLYVHGGPGRPRGRAVPQLFDPAIFRLILLDQRGVRHSHPRGEISANTTQLLIDDIERLRTHRGIEAWHVFGGSWGSCLGLCYAISHPDRVLSLVLWGIFLARSGEHHWVNTEARWMFPAACDRLVSHVGTAEPMELLRRYRDLIVNPDPAVHGPAIEAYSQHQAALSNIHDYDARLDRDEQSIDDLRPQILIELWYFLNHCFIPDDYILANTTKLHGIPGTIIHGANDFICPVANAYDLARAWPGATLKIAPDAGHFVFEPGIAAAIIAAFQEIATRR